MPPQIHDTWRGTVWTTRTLIFAYLAIGVGLTSQPSRFANTPSYANLLAFAPAQAWGCAYIAAGAFLVAWRLIQTYEGRAHRGFGIFTHTAAVVLTLWWLTAFLVRYSTDDGTTIVNVVSWSVLLSLVVRSAHGIDGPRPA